MTERELISRVKKNDNDACKLLIEKYHKLIYAIINSYSLEYGDFHVSEDELYQEGCIGLYEACKTYKRVSHCKFSTFAYIVAKRRINKLIRRQLEIYKNESYSYDRLDNPDKRGIFEGKCVYDHPIEYGKHDNKETAAILAKLKKSDQKIIKLRLQGYSYDQISKITRIPKKKIDNRLMYLKKKRFYQN